MRIASLIFLFAAISMAHPDFLVSNGTVGGKISVLCENQSEIFVSSPDGEVAGLALDEYSQVEFAPKMAGPYTVQCGNETVVAYATQDGGAPGAVGYDEGSLAALSMIVLVLGFSIATFLAAKFLFLDRTGFLKTVEGGKVKIVLSTGKKLENAAVEDPVCIGYAGDAKEFRIGKLAAGKTWEFEYDVEGWDANRALPASLSAVQQGRKISLLSGLFIEGKKVAASERESEWAPKRAEGKDGAPFLGGKRKRRLPKAPH